MHDEYEDFDFDLIERIDDCKPIYKYAGDKKAI
jgi:hypothetical protein